MPTFHIPASSELSSMSFHSLTTEMDSALEAPVIIFNALLRNVLEWLAFVEAIIEGQKTLFKANKALIVAQKVEIEAQRIEIMA